MAGTTKTLSAVLVCGIVANAYLAWQLHSRLPPTTADLDQDLASLTAGAPAPTSDDPQVRAEVALAGAIRAQTREMLEQRRQAALRFVDVRYMVNGASIPPVDSGQVAALETDIAQQREAVKAAAAAADEVRGGSLKTQRLAALAMAQTTLALLERRHAAAKHGIALPATPASTSPIVDKDAMAALETDIAERRRSIAETKKDADQYAGGLIKVTLLQRLATEQVTLSGLEQRRVALKHGLPSAPGLTAAVATAAPPEFLAGIEADIARTQASITAGEREASLYSGGLIYVTILSRIATERMTLAMLEQRRLAIKHGILAAPESTAQDAPKGPPGTVVNDKDAL